MNPSTGIAALGLQLPSLALDVRELAHLRGVDPNKFTLGLGCDHQALCPEGIGAIDLAVGAAQRALASWDGNLDDIGLIAVGTETAADMSRPLSAYVAERLGLKGHVRSYEVKHACYGGTLALRQALEWRLSGAARGKHALVIASDVSLYTPGGPAEATQGAGAVAMIVGEPHVAAIDVRTHAYSAPAFDFWRPVGEPWPRVAGKLSLDCYNEAVIATFEQLLGERGDDFLDEVAAACFHVPFPKMVNKAVHALGQSLGWSTERTNAWYSDKVEPTMGWNRQSGNAYTASLWIAVAHALRGLPKGRELVAFSYGSGFGAELLTLTAGPAARDAAWQRDVQQDLRRRTVVGADAYLALRDAEVRAIAAK